MKITGKKPWYLEYLLIIIGTGLMATAITSCFDAAGMVTGGFSGIAIIVKAGTKGLYGNGVPLWVTNLVLNVPVFILAAKIKGFSFVKKALMGDISLTVWLAVLPAWKLSEDIFLAALYGGILQGVGIGMTASFIGTVCSVAIATVLSPVIAEAALHLGPWEYFSLDRKSVV